MTLERVNRTTDVIFVQTRPQCVWRSLSAADVGYTRSQLHCPMSAPKYLSAF